MSESDLPWFMMRDPFKKSLEIKVDGTEVESALKRLFPNKPPEFRVMIASPVGRPKYIIDATPDGQCSICNGAVWLSPSSKRTAVDATLCGACLEKALAKL